MMHGYYNLNKLIIQVEKLSLWKTIWIGIKISLILIPTLWAVGHFLLGH